MVFQAAVCSDYSQLGFSAHVIVEADEPQDPQAGDLGECVVSLPLKAGRLDTQEELMFPFKASEQEALVCRETGKK